MRGECCKRGAVLHLFNRRVGTGESDVEKFDLQVFESQ